MEQAADRYTPVMAQWGIPDPRQASGYPADGTLFVQWAWEFLRRRDDYRAQWSETIAPYLGADGEFDEAAWDRAKEKLFRQAAMAGQPCRVENPFKVLARNFGLHWTTGGFDPGRSNRPVFEAHLISFESWRSAQNRQEQLHRQEQERGQELPPELRREILNPSPRPLGEYECSVTFNVAFPLKPQLEAAEKILQDFVRNVPPDRLVQPGRPQADKFARYLRVLDFDDIGPRRAAVRDSRRAAGDWQRDYLSLVMAAES
jgi:hypothetical protein